MYGKEEYHYTQARRVLAAMEPETCAALREILRIPKPYPGQVIPVPQEPFGIQWQLQQQSFNSPFFTGLERLLFGL